MPTQPPPPLPPGPAAKRPSGGSATSSRPGPVARPGAAVSSAPANPAPRTGPNRSTAALVGPVGRAVASLDNRLLRLAANAIAPAERKRAQVEMALLSHLRRGLAPYAEEIKTGEDGERIDTVLMETLLGGVEHALGALGDLDADRGRRAGRLLGFVRELVAQLAVLGGDVTSERARVGAAQKRLAADPKAADGALAEAEALWPLLAKKLDDKSPRKSPSLLDEWLRPSAAVSQS